MNWLDEFVEEFYPESWKVNGGEPVKAAIIKGFKELPSMQMEKLDQPEAPDKYFLHVDRVARNQLRQQLLNELGGVK